MQKKHCPICKNQALAKMGNLTDYWYCADCKLGWIKQIPSVAYEEEYYSSGSSILATLFVPIEAFFYRIREHYAGFAKKNLWIDVGAGDGNFVKTVHAKKKMGVEISKSGRNTMKKKGLLVLTNDAFLKQNAMHADVISFWQVLEHVTKPWKYIEAAEINLNTKGKIIIAVPNISSLEFQLFRKYWFHLAPRYHIWHFSPKSMQKMLTAANLKVDHIDYWAIEHHLTGILQTFINRTTNSEDLLHKLIKRRQNLQSLKPSQIFWILFWCTVGLPIVFLFWFIEIALGRPGTFVIVASKIDKS